MHVRDLSKPVRSCLFDTREKDKEISAPYRLETVTGDIVIKTDIHESFGSTIYYLRIDSSQQLSALRILTECNIEHIA